MTEKRRFEFFLLRYVPHAIRQKYVDFGVILVEKDVQGGYTGVRFLLNRREIQDLDPRADIEILEAFTREVNGQWSVLQDPRVFISWVQETHSNLIQVTQGISMLGDDPVEEMESLVKTYLSEIRMTPDVERQESGRRLILNRMQEELRGAGVWTLLKHGISVGQYTKTDDSYKFDCGYVVGGKLKMFHAVSLEASLNPALDLGSKYRKMTTEKAEDVKVSFSLTAVTEDAVNHADERLAYVTRAMRNDGIEIVGLARMPEIAERARVELEA